ncbi:MAG: hypothetical protein M1818_005704 [Claussenomyces sp. TS43310]|nr:MAG: hypothetical protein M1818_005704 [Claussenomyces sp. TS43310]
MAQITEDQFKLPDGVELYRKTWHPVDAPIAKLIFIHGFSDHINRYYSLFPSLAARGILCVGIDQRGWGRSVHQPSERGNTGPTSQILSDVVALIKSQLPSPVPLFLMGHSMGGGEVLTLASTPQYRDLLKDIRGILLESPYVALPPDQTPSPVTVFLGRMAGKLLPHHQISHAIPVKDVVRDPVVQKSLEDDALCHNRGSLEMFANMLDRSAALYKGTLKLNPGVQALWLAHGTADRSTSHDASKKWFDTQTDGVVDKEFKTYDGWSHQLHADLPGNGEIFAKDVGDWILARCQGVKETSTEGQSKL